MQYKLHKSGISLRLPNEKFSIISVADESEKCNNLDVLRKTLSGV